MAHEIIASIRVVLPDATMEMTDKLAEVAKAWSVMLDQVKPTDGNASFSVNETRAKSATAGAKRGRPRKPPVLVPPPPSGEAA